MCVSSQFLGLIFFFKQKTAYEVRISDWSSDVCSSERQHARARQGRAMTPAHHRQHHRVADTPADPHSPRVHGFLDRQRVVSGKSVSVRVDLGGRRIITKKKTNIRTSVCTS